MSEEKKVLEILNSFPGETFIRQHALAMIQFNENIKLIWAFTQTPFLGRMRSWDFAGVECYALPNFNRLSFWCRCLHTLAYFGNDYKKLVRPQLRLLKQINPDLVHFHFASLAMQYGHLCEVLGIPYTISVRGSDIQVAPLMITDYKEKLMKTVKAAKAVHCVSESLKDELFRLIGPNDKTSIIRTIVSDEWTSLARKPEKGLLVSVGRLHWRKGYPDLLLACKWLIDSDINFHLVIIGEGPQRQELEFMIRDLDLQERVELIGQKSHNEIREWFSRAHALVLSSIAEGFPNVIAEAMMAGVPVITSDCGGITELVDDKLHALVYHAGNIRELEQKMTSFLLGSCNHDLVQNAINMSQRTFCSSNHAQSFESLWG